MKRKSDSTVPLRFDNAKEHDAVITICTDVKKAGGRTFAVGGCVRDAALGLPAKDIDLEIFHIPPEKLSKILTRHFKINLVGQSFGVVKINGLPIDVAIPRRESKEGLGHKGFNVLADPDMSHQEAAARRDFTINAISLDPLTGEIVDPFNGLTDLENRILRHTSERFSEDPLRVLRAMQFSARFDMQVAPETITLCQNIQPETLPRERIFDEWAKLILKGRKPSLGLTFLRQCGWIQYYPELQALINCPQDPTWHPEGDVWNHTLHSMDAFANERIDHETEDLIVGLAVLCHDFGKPVTTTVEPDGHIRSLGHDQAGEQPSRHFLERLTRQTTLVDDVVVLVVNHMQPHACFMNHASSSAIRRLAHKAGRIDRLVRVDRADRQGRSPESDADQSCGDWLLKRAYELEVADSAPRPIILGRHLQQLGLSPGPHFGPILALCYEAQLEGLITNEANGMSFAESHIPSA